MGINDEVETYPVGETTDYTVNLIVRDRSDTDISRWTVEVTTRGHHGPGSTLLDASFELPATAAERLATLLLKASIKLGDLIEGDSASLPDSPET